MSTVTPVPEDFHTITPHLVVREAARAVTFYKGAFGAAELYRNLAPDGDSIVHSELLLGDSRFFVNEEFPEHGQLSPLAHGGSAVTLHLYVEDVDAVFARAVAAGAEVVIELADQFWVTATAACAIHSGTSGHWPAGSKTSHPMRSINAPTPCSVHLTNPRPSADRRQHAQQHELSRHSRTWWQDRDRY